MNYVVTYGSADDVGSKAPAHYAATAARVRAIHARGKLLMIGIFAEAQADGAMGTFRLGRPPRSSLQGTHSRCTASPCLAHQGMERGARLVTEPVTRLGPKRIARRQSLQPVVAPRRPR